MISPPGRVEAVRPSTGKNKGKPSAAFKFGERRGSKQPSASMISSKYGYNMRRSYQEMDVSMKGENNFSNLDGTQSKVNKSHLSSTQQVKQGKRKTSAKKDKRPNSHKKENSNRTKAKYKGGITDFTKFFVKATKDHYPMGIGIYDPSNKISSKKDKKFGT